MNYDFLSGIDYYVYCIGCIGCGGVIGVVYMFFFIKDGKYVNVLIKILEGVN